MTTPLANLNVTATPSSSGTAGMYSGSFIDAGGNTFSSYATATIKNGQNIDTPVNFQQLLKFSPPPGANTDWSNVAFTLNGNELHSWVESQGSPSSIWVLLPDGIAAGKSITINIWVGKSSVSWDSYRGEAPQLSGTYGEYDNGADVFSNYWNFAGTALPSGWTGSGYSVNNGINANASGDYATYAFASAQTAPFVCDFYGYNDGTGSYQEIGMDNPPTRNAQIMFQESGSGPVFATSNGVNTQEVSVPSVSAFDIYTMEYASTSLAVGKINYGTAYQATSYIPTSIPALGMYNHDGHTLFIQWIRTRAYPPAGTMPSVSLSYPTVVSGTTDSNGNITMNLYNVKYSLTFSGGSLLQPYTVTLNPPANMTFTLYQITNNVKSGKNITVGGVTIAYGSSVWVYGGEGLAISVSDSNFVQWLPSSVFTNSHQASTTLNVNLTSDLSVNYSYYTTTTVDITSSETYTVPAGSTLEQVNMWGGGGAGAGSTTGVFGTGGGGSGGNLVFTLSIGAGTSIPITIGEGGNEGNSAFCGAIVGGGNGGSLNGPAGSSTIFGSPGDPYYAVAGGGAGGLSGSGGAGGAGGTNTPPTGSGISVTTNTSNPGQAGATASAVGGAGGAGSSGSGGSPAANTACPNDTPLYGAGGAGAGDANGDSMGGYGTNGIVTLTLKELVS